MKFKSLWRGEGTDYIAPAVAGSNPVGGVSRCSSMAEQWRNFPGRQFPPQKYSSVVKARVTSNRALRCKPERLRVRCSLVPKETVAQKQHASRLFPLERNSGMVQSRDTSSVTPRGAVAPLLGPIFLPEMFEGKGPHPRMKKNGPLSDSSKI